MSEKISEIQVRPAEKNDSEAVARLLMMAWPMDSFLEMSPGMTEDDFALIIKSFVESEDTLYSYRNTIVAVRGEEIAGAMNGYDGALYEMLKKPVTDDFSRRFPDSSSGFGLVKETEAGEFYLDSIGVNPAMRSMGIGSRLFSAMLERAAGLGFTKAGLIVDVDKPKAEALYLRLGFKTVGYRDFMGHPMKHMQIDL